MKLLNTAWSWLADEPWHLRGMRALQIAIGLALLFRAFTELPFVNFLYGPHGLGLASGRASGRSKRQTEWRARAPPGRSASAPLDED